MKRFILTSLAVLLLPATALAEPRPNHEGIGLAPAVRLGNFYQTEVPVPPTTLPSPYAPEGLSDCDEMNWYRVAVGLPEAFSGIGWRESNCRNEDGVKTYCCHGWWQMYFDQHWSDHRMRPRYEACGVFSLHDYNSDTPEEKLAQACAAKALFDVAGTSPWAATR